MKKRLLAAVALLLCLILTGCVSTEGLKKVPGGERPESLDVANLEAKFPSDSSIKNQLMGLAAEIQAAPDIDTQREKYNEFLLNAYIYIVGPYNYTLYLANDGRSISTYYQQMVNHMNTFISEYDVSAWTAIGQSSWGVQLKSEYEKLMCTPDSIRNVYPVSDETGKTQVQAIYNARDALLEAAEEDFADSDRESLLDDLFTSRQTLAETMGYDNYLDFLIEKREKLPYDREQLLALCRIVKSELVPALQSFAEVSAPKLSAQEWNEKLPALAERFEDYEEDLSYSLKNGGYVVEEGEETRFFAHMLYQYDTSIGKAVISGGEEDALTVLRGLGLEARDMALEQGEWSMSALNCYDQVQSYAFAGAAIRELDAVYGEEKETAGSALAREMALEVTRAAMTLELLDALYQNPVMAQSEREALVESLAEEYGLEADPDLLVEDDDITLGSVDTAGTLLGGLYGLQVAALEDGETARQVLLATLSVYNAGNPISAGYGAGLGNPYSAEGVRALAEKVLK